MPVNAIQHPTRKDFSLITTRRLVLRKPGPSDADAFYRIYSNADAMAYWSTPPHTDIETTRRVVDNSIRGWEADDYFEFSIQRLEDDEVIGKAVLFNRHTNSRRAEVGYLLSPDHWGQGYMTEVMTALIHHAFGPMNLRRLEADIDPKNQASRALLERLGFQKEGVLKERWEINGRVTDSEVYGLLARDWLNRETGSNGSNF